ncbi:MAG: hypothetical protein ACRCWQ_07545 [Bacilli bacterium]
MKTKNGQALTLLHGTLPEKTYRIRQCDNIVASFTVHTHSENTFGITRPGFKHTVYYDSPLDYRKTKRCGVDKEGIIVPMLFGTLLPDILADITRLEGFLFLELDYYDLHDHKEYNNYFRENSEARQILKFLKRDEYLFLRNAVEDGIW